MPIFDPGHPGGRCLPGRVDPHRGRQIRRLRPSLDEPFGMRRIRGGEHALAMRAHRDGLSGMDDSRRQETERTVTMLVVVPAEEGLPERPAILDRSESLRKLGTVLERLAVGF